MTGADAGNADQQSDVLHHLTALGDAQWRVRQNAIECLAKVCTTDVIEILAGIIRDEHRELSRLNATIQVLTRTESDVIPAVLPLLTAADAETRASAALTLGLRGDPRAIPGLLASMSDSDTNVRTHAIEALGRLRAAAAVDSLLQLVESREFDVAFPALDALMMIGDERIAARLVPLLQDSMWQSAAAEGLGALGDEEAVIPLTGLLNDSTVAMGTVAKAIQRIHDRQVSRYGHGRPVIEIVRQIAPARIAALRACLPGLSLAEKQAVISIIGWIPGREADAALLDLLEIPELRDRCRDALVGRGITFVPELLERFERTTAQTRLSFIDLCGRVADRRVIPTLVSCLDADDETVAKVLEAFSRICDSRVYESAKAFLGHPNLQVRHAAISALTSLGHPDTARDMEQRLRESSPLLRESALKVAAYFAFPECIDSILACCESPTEQLRRTAIENLPCLDDPRIVEELQKAMNSSSTTIRAAAAGALGEIDPQWALSLLRQALQDDDVWVRYFALRSQAQIPYGTDTLTVLAAMAGSDPAMQVRIAAVEAMKSESILEIIDASASPDDDLAVAAIAALGRTGRPEALPVLARAANSPQERRAIEAIRALGRTGLAGAIDDLEPLARNRNSLLADEAIAALGLLAFAASTSVLLNVLETPAKRPAAVTALVKQGDPVIPVLARRLQDVSLDVRLAVLQALIGLRSPEATALLESALADPEPAVRYAAISALAHIKPVDREIRDGGEGDA